MNENIKTYYFTFGCGQVYANCYHKIKAKSSEIARKTMCDRFGLKWSIQYDTAEQAGIEKWNLTEIKLQKKN